MRCWVLFGLLLWLGSAARSADTPPVVPDLRGNWTGTVQRARKEVPIELHLRWQDGLRRDRRLHVDLVRGRFRGFGFHRDGLQASIDSRRRFKADVTEEDRSIYLNRATVSEDGNTITGRFSRWEKIEDTEGTVFWKQNGRGTFTVTRTGPVADE
jgi:hypothetical protein